MKNDKTSLKELYTVFFKVGLFTFGGGYAMLPIIEREVVNNKKWVSYEELLDYYAVSQTTPGIIMINVATFIGYKERGLIGGIVSTLGVISPSLIIITLIASLIENFASISYVQSALKGIAAGISAIMISSMIKLGKSSIKDILSVVLCMVGFVVSYFTKISIIYVVVFGIAIGIIRYKLLEVKK
ncbi:MAG: chromate transporter [Erysipelotrichaceae bacterium]|nr:chromate transporter [Erysipelotrichaceae bacterium]